VERNSVTGFGRAQGFVVRQATVQVTETIVESLGE